MGERPRVLVAVLVYGGQDVVPACLESAVRQATSIYDVDVLVLDDHSPDVGWSSELSDLCAQLNVSYHRNARNLGIPRNMSLALRAGTEGYDHVLLCNSDVVLGSGVVEHLALVADNDESVASVTAWSNNVSIFSLTDQPGDVGPGQAHADLLDELLWDEFGTESVTIPVGVGFCMLMPVRAIEQVGVMDPIFGRGYCEEVDWCLRAHELGLRHALALGGFVFHHGGVSARAAGLLGSGETTDWAHEAVIDHRYPWYRDLVDDFLRASSFGAARERASATVVREMLRRGYGLTVGAVGRGGAEVLIDPKSGSGRAVAFGFQLATPDSSDLDELIRWCGRTPDRINVLDRGPASSAVAEWARANDLGTLVAAPYPISV